MRAAPWLLVSFESVERSGADRIVALDECLRLREERAQAEWLAGGLGGLAAWQPSLLMSLSWKVGKRATRCPEWISLSLQGASRAQSKRRAIEHSVPEGQKCRIGCDTPAAPLAAATPLTGRDNSRGELNICTANLIVGRCWIASSSSTSYWQRRRTRACATSFTREAAHPSSYTLARAVQGRVKSRPQTRAVKRHPWVALISLELTAPIAPITHHGFRSSVSIQCSGYSVYWVVLATWQPSLMNGAERLRCL